MASLHYADNLYNFSSSIVSSIEFDRDDEYFASAGVTKKIKLFDFASVVAGTTMSSNFITKTQFQNLDSDKYSDDRRSFNAPKYPIKEMSCNSKIRFRLIYLVAYLGIFISNLIFCQVIMKEKSDYGMRLLEP